MSFEKYLKGVERLAGHLQTALHRLDAPRNRPPLEVREARQARNAARRKQAMSGVPKRLR